ncbi:MAG TPA: allantoicase, partial [Candidatus Marinimicrobia bacterium]|nr:allantoicase [Candidatus Neomarinimicrobiota bacterium]
MQKKTKENLIDLSSEENGGSVLLASDEFFAPKENLLKKGRGEFIPDKYTELGKWMDGWETRRRRKKGHDWCL